MIIDFPIMLFIQQQFLFHIPNIHASRLHLLTEDGDEIRKGAINLVPIGFGKTLKEISVSLNPDVFLATRSLSEATAETQAQIRELDFFHAKYILYGHG